ncbi:hypothetical protein DM01DRAFT_245488, partial [Hesseltinella vesiculosa]
HYLSNYQPSIKALKEQGYKVVGYARKSPTNDSSDDKARWLQAMVDILRDRSLATRAYVSCSSLASTSFEQRDTKETSDIMEKLADV